MSSEDNDLLEKKGRLNELDLKNYKTMEEDMELDELGEYFSEFEMTEGIINEEFHKFGNAQQQLAKAQQKNESTSNNTKLPESSCGGGASITNGKCLFIDEYNGIGDQVKGKNLQYHKLLDQMTIVLGEDIVDKLDIPVKNKNTTKPKDPV